MGNGQLVNQVRAYQTAKLQAANKHVPFYNVEWLAFDYKKLLEEVGELGELLIFFIYSASSDTYKARICEEIADVAIVLTCIASHYGIKISMDEKLAVLRLRMEEMGSCKEER